jgi:hypothetical protein
MALVLKYVSSVSSLEVHGQANADCVSGTGKLPFRYTSDEVTAKQLFFLDIRVIYTNIVQDTTRSARSSPGILLLSL